MLLSMRLLYLFNLLTFVAGLMPADVMASPQATNPPSALKNPLKTKPESENTDPLKEETTQISYPQNYVPQTEAFKVNTSDSLSKTEVRSSARKLNTVSLSFDSGYFISNEINKNILLLNYKRSILTLDEAALEFGLGFSPQNIAMMQMGQRWNWKTWTSSTGDDYLFYFNFNVLNYIDSSQMLAGLINVNHFKLQLAFGLDDIEIFKEKLHAEVGAAYGVNGFSASANLGWKF